MMNYEIFKEVVVEKFMDYMPEYLKSVKMVEKGITRVNVTLDGITFISSGARISPTVYINDMYEDYKNSNDLNKVLEKAVQLVVMAFDKIDSGLVNADFPSEKENIVFQLINTEQNKELLSDIPNRQFHDLSIIYRMVICKDERGIQSAVVHKGYAERLGLNEEQLYNLAMKNTRRIFPPVIEKIDDVIRRLIGDDVFSEMFDDVIETEMAVRPPMWVVTNSTGVDGANSMLYEDVLCQLAEKAGTDLYILPSSIHEIIAVSADMLEPDELVEMVEYINMNAVSLEERLSNQVYFYDKDKRTLSQATDTPHKRLDVEPEYGGDEQA